MNDDHVELLKHLISDEVLDADDDNTCIGCLTPIANGGDWGYCPDCFSLPGINPFKGEQND